MTKNNININNKKCKTNIILAEVLLYNIKHYSLVYNDMIKKTNNNRLALDEAAIHIMNEKNIIKITKSKKEYYKKIIKRSYYLYNNYYYVLDKIYFNFSTLYVLNEIEWKEWLKYLDCFVSDNFHNNMIYESDYETAESTLE